MAVLAFILATVGVAVVIGWLALSWRVRQFWLCELGLRRHSWGLACAERCVRWRWCLRHPFNDGADNLWPADCSDLGPAPPEDLPRTRGASGGFVSERWAGATSGHE